MKHGMYKTKIYSVWNGIKQRCLNKNSTAYKMYGEKGINICEDWKIFINFYNWAINNGYEEGLTIDRIDNNNGYYPNNCRWVDYTIQNNNRNCSIKIEAFGENKTILEWEKDKRCVVKANTLYIRIFRQKWNVEEAITQKQRKNQYK